MGPTKKTNKMHVQHNKKSFFFKHVALSEHFYSIFPGGWYVYQNSFLPFFVFSEPQNLNNENFKRNSMMVTLFHLWYEILLFGKGVLQKKLSSLMIIFNFF